MSTRRNADAPAEQDNRPVRYLDPDGTVVYRASGLGLCDRMIVATSQPQYTPAPHPPWFQDVLDEGTAAEPLIDAMHSERTGVGTSDQQKVVELGVGSIGGQRVIVRGHIDGIAETSGIMLREFKKIRQSGWEHFKRHGVEHLPQYPWQVSIMMHALEADGCEFVGGLLDPESNLNTGVKIIDTYVHSLLMPPLPLIAIVKRVKKLERLVQMGFDAREVDCSGGFPCPYWKPWPVGLHDESEQGAFVVNVRDNEHGTLVFDAFTRLQQISAQQKALEEEKAGLSAGVRVALEALGYVPPVPEPATPGKRKPPAPKIVAGDLTVSHVVSVVPEHTVKESTRDYFMFSKRDNTEKDTKP